MNHIERINRSRARENKVMPLDTKRVNTKVELSPQFQGIVQPEASISERTDALYRGLNLILRHHRVKDSVRHELLMQLHDYLDISPSEKVWIKKVKNILNRPLAKYLNNDFPEEQGYTWRPRGELRDWMKSRLNAKNDSNAQLWYSWLQCKRSTLPVGESFVEDTYLEHFKTLSKRDEGDEDVINQIFNVPTFRRCLDSLRKEVATRMVSAAFLDRSTSCSASFEHTRAMGGQHSYLVEETGLNFELPQVDELFSMSYRPHGIINGHRKSNLRYECRTFYGREEWKDIILKRLDGIDTEEPIKCTIQAVLEPMKVRVISKGESIPYYSCKPLQVAMHSAMREMSCFRLIGRPFSPTDLLDLTNKATPNMEWFSIDYSGATDGLSWAYSGRILKYLMFDLDPRQQQLAWSVLGPHALHYPVKENGRTQPVFKGVQANGQLMGSILSFPILCMANLGVYLLNTDNEQWNWPDEDRLNHVLVNGDDMLYASDPSRWESHVRLGKAVGLQMSPGKAYRHKSYSNINSIGCILDLNRIKRVHTGKNRYDVTPKQIDFLNAGLFFGQHKVQSSDKASSHHSDDMGNLTANINCLLQGSLPGRRSELLSMYLDFHKESIIKETRFYYGGRPHSRNLFIPISLGGMGVEHPCGFSYRTTSVQKKYAEIKLCQINDVDVSLGLPLPGYEVKEDKAIKDVPWMKPGVSDEKDVIRVKRTAMKGVHHTLLVLPFFYYDACRILISTEDESFVHHEAHHYPDFEKDGIVA
jgi:hypothetical protein